MSLTNRETWGLIHGLLLGSFFLLAFAGGLAELYGLRTRWETDEGIVGSVRRLTIGFWAMAVAAWLTVITGTWIVYPWYRAAIPTSPRSLLLADPSTAEWHTFGMEWKEHVAWFAPIIATVVAFAVFYYGPRLAKEPGMRNVLIALFIIAFATAGVAGLFGAFINKAAPIT